MEYLPNMLFFLPTIFLAWISILSSASGNSFAAPLHEFSCGKLFYRTLSLDGHAGALYVGAMNHLFKLNLDNINSSSCNTPKFEPDFRRRCESIGKSRGYQCQNHIRVVQPLLKGQYVYVCGTNAFRPRDWIVHATNLTEVNGATFPGIGDGIAKCPFDPDDNGTAVWVEEGNPGNYPALYSATVADVSRADHLLFRSDLYDSHSTVAHPYLRSVDFDPRWLSSPDFVASFDIGEHVYFFFRENAIEYGNVGRNIYSRVARVCKKDTGGRNVLEQNWSSFVKARLNCSIPGDIPYYFDSLQSLVKSDTARTSAITFYGTFTSSLNAAAAAVVSPASAVCAFTLDDIDKAFSGLFKEQTSVTSAWLPVMKADVPEPRPGKCAEDSKGLPDNVLTFIKNHPIMHSAVAPLHGRPLLVRDQVLLTKLVVVPTIAEGYEYLVIFTADNTGSIYKVIHWYDTIKQQVMARTIDVWNTMKQDGAIRNMVVSPDHRSLYVASDYRVLQFSVASCSRYASHCSQCTRDPFCVWNREKSTCQDISEVSESLKWRPDPNFLQDVRDERLHVCEEVLRWQNETVTLGSTVHLSCPIPKVSTEDGTLADKIVWTHNKTPLAVGQHNQRLLLTTSNGLIITRTQSTDVGQYVVHMDRQVLCRFHLHVDQDSCQAPRSESDYKKAYHEWCDEFQRYKSMMHKWQKSKKIAGLTAASG